MPGSLPQPPGNQADAQITRPGNRSTVKGVESLRYCSVIVHSGSSEVMENGVGNWKFNLGLEIGLIRIHLVL